MTSTAKYISTRISYTGEGRHRGCRTSAPLEAGPAHRKALPPPARAPSRPRPPALARIADGLETRSWLTGIEARLRRKLAVAVAAKLAPH
jgi:hypothetical protein